jgi:hypothetical protein
MMETSGVKSRRTTEWLLVGGLLAGPLFTLVYLVEGATREGYSAWRHPVSSLALSKYGWRQMANFLSTGALFVAFGVGARRTEGRSKWLPRLIGAIGVGLVGAGVFRCDPRSGYPPGTPARPARASTNGILHAGFSALVFFGLSVALLAEARSKEPLWALYSRMTCLGFLSALALATAGFAQRAGLVRFGGLFQRLALCFGFAWLSLRAAHVLRRMAAA